MFKAAWASGDLQWEATRSVQECAVKMHTGLRLINWKKNLLWGGGGGEGGLSSGDSPGDTVSFSRR